MQSPGRHVPHLGQRDFMTLSLPGKVLELPTTNHNVKAEDLGLTSKGLHGQLQTGQPLAVPSPVTSRLHCPKPPPSLSLNTTHRLTQFWTLSAPLLNHSVSDLPSCPCSALGLGPGVSHSRGSPSAARPGQAGHKSVPWKRAFAPALHSPEDMDRRGIAPALADLLLSICFVSLSNSSAHLPGT